MNEQSENNVENQEPGPAGSGGKETGQNSTDPGDARTAKRTRTSTPLVERVTALRGQGIESSKKPKRTLRRQTQTDIYDKDAEIPYVKLEAAARALVCSLMERQDRMNEEIFSKLNDLTYRVEDLEENRPTPPSVSGDAL
jgi:hypothetical protein